MRYKALFIIATALLAAPLAFAEGPNSSSDGMPPPPPQGDHRGPSLLNILHVEMHSDVEGRMGSSTQGRPPMPMHSQMGSSTHDWNRPTTTPDGRPLPMPHSMGSSTNPGLGWGDKRGDDAREHMMPGRQDDSASSTMGSSTARSTTHIALRGFLHNIFSFFAGNRGDASSTSSTPLPHDDDASTTASSTVEASAQQFGPTRPILQFLQHLFTFLP